MTTTRTFPGTTLSPTTIRGPEDLKDRSPEELQAFADQVRAFLIDRVARTGGHIGANLGTVELTIALHKVFHSPGDALVWDTGHQGYTHKIVTGRAGLFPTLNTYGGMNRFLTRSESVHDPIEASHAGTAVSIALGIALGRRLKGDPRKAIAVVGDGALAEGITFEALNHAAVAGTNLIVVVNDNGYAISPGYGGLHEALQGGRAAPFFEALGFDYLGPVDGHDVGALVRTLAETRTCSRTPVVHVKTVKGHGWQPADAHPYRAHFSFPFHPATGAPRTGDAAPVPGYPEVAARVLGEEMERDGTIVCLTPSTLYATGLEPVFRRFPERCFDPGMEEQHAMTLTVGLALEGLKPVIAYQSTFLQRAFDQLLHDVCFMNLPTLVLSYRSGFSGYDNPTHHGIYDFAWLRGLPNLRLLYPKDRHEAERMVRDSLRGLEGPTMVLMPYGPADDFDPGVLEEDADSFAAPQVVREGSDLLLLTVGHKYGVAHDVVSSLRLLGVDGGLVNLRRLKPLPAERLVELCERYPRLVTLEEGVLDGGVGSAIASLVTDHGLDCDVLRLGLPCTFVEPGSNAELAAAYGLDAAGVQKAILRRWVELGSVG